MTEGLEAIVTNGVASRLPRLFAFIKNAYNEEEVKWLLALHGVDSPYYMSLNGACRRLAVILNEAIIRGKSVRAALLKDRPGLATDINEMFTEFGQMKEAE